MEAVVLRLPLPEYALDGIPDFAMIGAKADALVRAHFPGRIALRGLSAADHPGRSVDELIALIRRLGTDRYDPDRKGVLHDFYAPFGVELHALPCAVDPERGLTSSHVPDGGVTADILSDFYSGPPADRDGPPLRLDLLLVYDRDQLEPLAVPYDGVPSPDPCEFRFRDPERKADALRGIIHLG